MAKLDGNPSYIWRSIMEAQVLLKKEVVLSVSTGVNIKILNDHRLPSEDDPYVHTQH